MWQKIRLHLKNFDWIIFLSAFLLSCFGLLEIYSVALGQGSEINFLNFRKQIFFIAGGAILTFIFAFIDSHYLKSIRRYLYWLGAAILVAVLVLGQTIRGTKGWFYVFGFGIQPVEFIKIILIVYLSGFLADLGTKVKNAKHFLIAILSTGLLTGLVLLQPDFGSALILSAIWIFLILIAGFDKKYFIFIAIAALAIFTIAWFALFKDYQKERILTFIHPAENSLEEGYNIAQATIAVGSGNISGKGVGFGSQSQLKFLPEAQNDFIFAVIAEELGFLGVLIVLGLFATLFFRLIVKTKPINNDYGIFIILGGVGLIFMQMFINIGMNIGIMPVVGLSLPFVSYGGSSILASFVLIGIMENIIIKSRINY
jgi:rod shape determining protein RodA